MGSLRSTQSGARLGGALVPHEQIHDVCYSKVVQMRCGHLMSNKSKTWLKERVTGLCRGGVARPGRVVWYMKIGDCSPILETPAAWAARFCCAAASL